MTDLILASTSPWRRKMLEDAGLPIRCVSPGVDERAWSNPDPSELALALATAKASAVFARYPSAWVIGADQVVTDGVEIWGKPVDPDDHLRQLQRLRGTSHELVTGFCLVGPGFLDEGVERTRLWVRDDLSDDELRAYVGTREGSQCAGGYAAEGRGGQLFSRIEGDWFNVLGLPMLRVITAMRRRGWRFGAAASSGFPETRPETARGGTT